MIEPTTPIGKACDAPFAAPFRAGASAHAPRHPWPIALLIALILEQLERLVTIFDRLAQQWQSGTLPPPPPVAASRPQARAVPSSSSLSASPGLPPARATRGRTCLSTPPVDARRTRAATVPGPDPARAVRARAVPVHPVHLRYGIRLPGILSLPRQTDIEQAAAAPPMFKKPLSPIAHPRAQFVAKSNNSDLRRIMRVDQSAIPRLEPNEGGPGDRPLAGLGRAQPCRCVRVPAYAASTSAMMASSSPRMRDQR